MTSQTISSDLEINSNQLTTEIDHLATLSDVPAPCVTRVLFTPQDINGRKYVKELATACGLAVREDALGNIFLRWQGEVNQTIATGSHTDAIPYSGKYDGVVGVLGAIEAIRSLKRIGFKPHKSIEIIMFTAEEPTRFGIGCLGSRALAGTLSVAQMTALKDNDGITLNEARHKVGYDGNLEEVALPRNAYDAFIELHIEQGPELEAEQLDIGVVTAIAAPATVKIAVEGGGGHAGACTMPNRKDALIPAAKIAQIVQKAALESESADAVATTGFFQVYPGAVNSIPSKVTMEIDVRDTSLKSRDEMVNKIIEASQQISIEHGVSHTHEILNADPPATCDADIVEMISSIAAEKQLANKKMISRAYHDSLFMAQVCPTSMIFIPSQNGYSHRPEEYTAPNEIANGVKVLALTLAKLSSKI